MLVQNKDEGYGVKGRRLWGERTKVMGLYKLLNYWCLLKGREIWGDLLTLLIDKGFLKRTKSMG